MRRGAVLAGLLVLLAAPLAQADVRLQLPDEFRLSQATFLAGHVTLQDAVFANPVVAWPMAASGTGTLTVCPDVLGSGGLVRPTLIQVLANVQANCDGAQHFTDPTLAFGPDSQLAFAGDLAVVAMPGAALVAPFADDNGTLAMTLGSSRQPMRLGPDDGVTRFAGVTPATSVVVVPAQGDPIYFNGTSYAFLLDTDELRLQATALATGLNGPFRATAVPATRADLAEALADPFSLLDAQESLLGPEAREPRGNVSGLLREFGRVPAYVNGALVGRIDGAASGRSFDGSVALVRGDLFTVQRDGDLLVGTEEPRAAISQGGVSFGGGAVREAPWVLFGVVWAVALLVLVVRRRPPERAVWLRGVWGGMALAGVLLFDRFVLQTRFGTGFLAEARHGASPGTLLSLAAFEAILFAASFLALALPGRLLIGRLMPGARLRLLAEIAWGALWALLPLLSPAAFFSLGYDLARI